jgi:hypothetical protein
VIFCWSWLISKAASIGAYQLFTLTYDLWREIVEDVVISHQPLFESMHQAAEDLDLTTALIEELKRQEELPLPGDMDFKLVIDFFQDEIEGFKLEHGLNMQEEILLEMEETYGIQAEVGADRLIYYLVLFDSQDIDDSRGSELVWQEDVEN